MKIIVEAETKEDIEKNKKKLNYIRKLFPSTIEIIYHYPEQKTAMKLSDLAGLVSLGGDSIKDTEHIYG